MTVLHPSAATIVKFVDDTTVVGLISKNDETHYRKEVSQLATWCRNNNLLLNIDKTKEVVIDFRRGHTPKPPLTINGAAVERASSTKFLGVHISEDLSWTMHTASLAKKSQRCLYFLCKLKRAKAPQLIMCSFYRGTILTSCITLWCGSCTSSNSKTLQRIVKTDAKQPAIVENNGLAVGKKVGHGSIKSAAWMNGTVVIFLDQVEKVNRFIEAGITMNEMFVQLSSADINASKTVKCIFQDIFVAVLIDLLPVIF
ncbi:hypothetical protein F2P81_011907 [Scophthalmus maximus]|uniref:Alkylated DNA repair protein AlkB homologue 8 N-terminal domain-containing protein n=1 Tax=Scophthalmus maximus TaxID=52904 RepID=A0A6A4SV83_SCOMX|nr:hypothetical protein F2P81_011907 [Scophthalmus maximus]